jgi:addiction module HigA family antidote
MDEKPPMHPGEVLLEGYMRPRGVSQYRLAQEMGVPPIRVSEIVRRKRAISADTALRLARFLTTPASTFGWTYREDTIWRSKRARSVKASLRFARWSVLGAPQGREDLCRCGPL